VSARTNLCAPQHLRGRINGQLEVSVRKMWCKASNISVDALVQCMQLRSVCSCAVYAVAQYDS